MSQTAFDAFLFYRSYRESLNGMTQKDQLATLLAIIDYALYGVEPDLKGKMPAAIFTVVRPNIDANNAKRKAGKKGGRPKKETNGFSEDETTGFPKGESNEGCIMKDEGQRDEGQRECGAAEPPTRTRFVPPTVEEVATYVRERGSAVDPQVFWDFYAAKGWMVGKSKMKDWRAACRSAESWERWDRKPAASDRDRVKTEADYGEELFFTK